MKRYDADGRIPTLDVAVSEFMNAEDLKGLGALTGDKLPSRKADLAQVIICHLEGERIRTVWQTLDEIQRAAVAEVVHSRSTTEIGAPLVAGKTPEIERERIYERFRKGELRCIVLSKVGNFAIDLPDTDFLIQVSGAFGSRQEEAQRLGRAFRPKHDGRAARFFTLVSRDTREEEFAHHRKLFLTEQGYSYQVHLAEELSKAR
jgi:DNA excision repair protein ERCC-3